MQWVAGQWWNIFVEMMDTICWRTRRLADLKLQEIAVGGKRKRTGTGTTFRICNSCTGLFAGTRNDFDPFCRAEPITIHSLERNRFAMFASLTPPDHEHRIAIATQITDFGEQRFPCVEQFPFDGIMLQNRTFAATPFVDFQTPRLQWDTPPGNRQLENVNNFQRRL